MNLALAYGELFQAGDRRRGEAYFQQGRVTVVEDNFFETEAVVEGSGGSAYNVEICWADENAPEMRCDCPRFEDGYNCKHLYATLMAVGAARPISQQPRPSFPRGTRSGWANALTRITEMTVGDPLVDDPPTVSELIRSASVHCWYVISMADVYPGGELPLRLRFSEPSAGDDGSSPPVWRNHRGRNSYARVIDPRDQWILARLDRMGISYSGGLWRGRTGVECLWGPFSAEVIAAMAATGRLVWTLDSETDSAEYRRLRWDGDLPWQLVLSLEPAGGSNGHTSLALAGRLRRGDEVVSLAEVVMGFRDGLFLFPDRIGQLEGDQAVWLAGLCGGGLIEVPASELNEFMATLAMLPRLPELEIAPAIGITRTVSSPTGRIELTRPSRWLEDAFRADIAFVYGDRSVRAEDDVDVLWSAETRQLIDRDRAAEQELLSTLRDVGFRNESMFDDCGETLWLDAKCLSQAAVQLAECGWEVLIDRRPVRTVGNFRIELRSEQDWFDIDAQLDFDGYSASVVEILEAVRSRLNFISLGDGTQAIVPKELVERLAKLAAIGDENGKVLRVHRTQALLIDMLLADQPDVSVQRDFTQLCRKMRGFSGIKPAAAPRGFHGELRRYQSEGLGWFGFLRDFGFGGCLADDMGLGKTIQVLALLQSRRTRRLKSGEVRLPSLVVVPKSLVYNWISEADRFAPQLKIINHTGTQRVWDAEALAEADVLLTTYGTLRSDIEQLSEQRFDYAILDEAQAIKNAASQTAKACRLIRADHRLAMTGTPVENHLGELWSILDFLNPGMISQGRRRQVTQLRDHDSETCEMLRQSLRPFILRRTKEQVLQDLPAKVEETIYCEMPPKQKRFYDELRNYYRAQLKQKIGRLGIKKSKIHVLEALLRLRQAACDPRLLDPKHPVGVKQDVLCERLEQVISEGHKALVFSQFTSLLTLLRQELDKRRWVYEYLDGKTQQRAKRVQRFQNDAECPLFLISLKAGGQGLNLTAADYVFILDPWWNPAVEAQAIDRAHRIGQTQQVMAYRIICRDTVEEKIIALQQSKRELADAIITANESLIRQLTADDLELLLT